MSYLNILKLINILFFVSLLSNCTNPITEINTENKNLNAIDKLLLGNQRFINNKMIHLHQNLDAVKASENGQHPFAVILSCSDSRVSPNIVFDQGIGDLFIIRNAGNLVSNIDLGSIEYAVEHLHVKDIFVMGHTECGALKAFVADTTKNYKQHLTHIDEIIDTLDHEKEISNLQSLCLSHSELLGKCINANVYHSIDQIRKSHIIGEYNVNVTPLIYDIHTGQVTKI